MKTKTEEERQQLVVVAAAVALHALIASETAGRSSDVLIAQSFDIAEKFMAEAERRLGKL